MLQFHAPEPAEPICSGPELTLAHGQRIDLAHFHTVVTVTVNRPRPAIFGESADMALACSVAIYGREYDRQQFAITRDDIGSTLFCAGFPCVTVTGMDDGTVMLTHSEIVDLCEAGGCPCSDDSNC